ncbi:ROK family protein [Parafrigoribacterium mesophilum]|uniref:ROK family protein n=1 Tax=Parafrigoribacterium mesophilum TaxID=433646 RepID=UPI0031FC6772
MQTERKPVLALDIGGTKLAVGVLAPDGTLRSFIVEPTHREQGPAPVLRRLFGMGHRAVAEAGLDPGGIGAVGISCGGPLDSRSGVLLCPPHLPGWIGVPVGPLAAAEFHAPAVLANDATAGAWGEYRFGVGRGTHSLVYLTLSTGMGGGAVLDGRLHRGAAGNGGELGHLMVHPGDRLCTCGRRGCIEAYASGTAIAERAAAAVSAGRPSSLASLSTITARDVAAAGSTDSLAREVWDETTELLGIAVTDLVNVFEPDLVVFGGGVARAGDLLIDPVARIVASNAMGPARAAVRIALTALGDTVCVVGAGALALDELQPEPRHPQLA